MKQTRTRALCECAIMLALAVILSFIQFGKLPFGGAITPASMLPICIIAIKYGTKWGLGTAFCYAWFQILQGGVFGWGLTPVILIASILLDYILAFLVLGLAGIFSKKGTLGMTLGIAMACVLRFLTHFVSGIVLWANLEQFVAFGESFVNRPVLYSLLYNGSYMLPETVLTVAVAIVLFQVPQIKHLLVKGK